MLRQVSIGTACGLAVGAAAVTAFRRVRFGTQGLYPVASIAAAAISYGLADVLSGSGFLAVYLTGLVLGSARIPARRTVDDFHAGLAWVSQIALFLTLGLLVFPSDLDRVTKTLVAAANRGGARRPETEEKETGPEREDDRRSEPPLTLRGLRSQPAGS